MDQQSSFVYRNSYTGCRSIDESSLRSRASLNKTISTNEPAYLHSLLKHYVPSCSLRSSDSNLLSVARVRTCFGSRSFAVAAPTIWNTFPLDIRYSPSVHCLRCDIKTFFYGPQIQRGFPVDIVCNTKLLTYLPILLASFVGQPNHVRHKVDWFYWLYDASSRLFTYQGKEASSKPAAAADDDTSSAVMKDNVMSNNNSSMDDSTEHHQTRSTLTDATHTHSKKTTVNTSTAAGRNLTSDPTLWSLPDQSIKARKSKILICSIKHTTMRNQYQQSQSDCSWYLQHVHFSSLFYARQGSYRSGKTGKSQGIWVVRERSGENIYCKSQEKVRENEKLMPPGVWFSS